MANWLATFLVFITIPASAQNGDVEEEVLAAVERFGIAYQQADVKALSEMLANDYVHVNGGSGSRIGREQWLAWVQSQRELLDAGLLRVDSYEVGDLEVQAFGDTAVVTGVVRSSGVRQDEPFEVNVRFTNLWVFEDAAWRRAAFHDSPLPNNLPHAFDAGWKGEITCQLLYETDEVRVGRCDFPPGVGHEKHYHNPHFGYVIQGSTLRITDAEGTRDVETTAGGTWSTDTITVHEALNVGDVTTSYLIVEPRAAEVRK